LNSPEQAERNITQNWAQFACLNEIELIVCSNSAMKRGILDKPIAKQTGHSVSNLNPQFKLAGLGQFVDAVSKSDRLVSFGQGSV
jgi:tRNA 2-thiouridine synthesizing protein D